MPSLRKPSLNPLPDAYDAGTIIGWDLVFIISTWVMFATSSSGCPWKTQSVNETEPKRGIFFGIPVGSIPTKRSLIVKESTWDSERLSDWPLVVSVSETESVAFGPAGTSTLTAKWSPRPTVMVFSPPEPVSMEIVATVDWSVPLAQ